MTSELYVTGICDQGSQAICFYKLHVLYFVTGHTGNFQWVVQQTLLTVAKQESHTFKAIFTSTKTLKTQPVIAFRLLSIIITIL